MTLLERLKELRSKIDPPDSKITFSAQSDEVMAYAGFLIESAPEIIQTIERQAAEIVQFNADLPGLYENIEIGQLARSHLRADIARKDKLLAEAKELFPSVVNCDGEKPCPGCYRPVNAWLAALEEEGK